MHLWPKVEHGKENNGYANRDVDDGSEDLPLFGKERALPCLQTKIIVHSLKQGVVEYLDLGEEDGMSDIQVVEIKRPRCSARALAHKNLKREWVAKKR
jgi:hypothetical protein